MLEKLDEVVISVKVTVAEMLCIALILSTFSLN
jgi:hypothetical protein